MADDLGGVWSFVGQTAVPDDALALAAGHRLGTGRPAVHGTYTDVRYYRLIEGPASGTLTILDESGACASFSAVPGDPLLWRTSNDPTRFHLRPNDPEATIVRTSSFPSVLRLAALDPLPPGRTMPWEPRVAEGAQAARVQCIRFSKDQRSFNWYPVEDPDSGEGLQFLRYYVQPRKAGSDKDCFGEIFRDAKDLSQLAFPFYGYDARKLAWPFSTPGTPAPVAESNPNQIFSGTLLFKFPTQDSHDYVRGIDAHGMPFLPLGLAVCEQDVEISGSQTQMVSSTSERVDGWSAQLGLSAGVKKLFTLGVSGSMSEKVSQQRENQSRYTLSRNVTQGASLRLLMPQLEIHDDFQDELQERLHELMSGKAPHWGNFCARFGTHYAYAMTLGSIEVAETRMTLAAEARAHEKNLDLCTEANGVLEGALSVTEKSKFSQEWSTKLHTKFEAEDVTRCSVGKDFRMGILFDLRPISNLLNPILFDWNPADQWQRYAPFVWSLLRRDLDEYLRTKLHLNQPMDPSLVEDVAPRIVEVSFRGLTVVGRDHRWGGDTEADRKHFGYGTIAVRATGQEGDDPGKADGDQGPAGDDQVRLAQHVDFRPEGIRLDSPGHDPGKTEFSCVLLVRRGAVPRFDLEFDLGIRETEYQWDTTAHCRFTGRKTIECKSADEGGNKLSLSLVTKQLFGLDIDYTLSLDVVWEERALPAPLPPARQS